MHFGIEINASDLGVKRLKFKVKVTVEQNSTLRTEASSTPHLALSSEFLVRLQNEKKEYFIIM